MKRVIGLDSLRFVLAFIVLLGHGAMPVISEGLVSEYKLLYYLDLLLKLIQPTGVAAVMGFFVISGFVIHFPYSEGKKINVSEFYCRRILRIVAPALVAFIIYHFTFNLYMGVVWSLVCEVIYYLLYPLILRYKAKYMKQILVISFVCSYIATIIYTITSDVYNGDFHRNGFFFAWVVGLPAWLLGVVLADQYKNIKSGRITYMRLCIWRLGLWAIASFCLILRFHLSIAYGYTLPLFAILVFFWLKNEISYYVDKKENRILEYGGLMSYSLYLMHYFVIFSVGFISNTPKLVNNWALCLIAIISSLLISWVFYLLVEKPSHKLARSIKI